MEINAVLPFISAAIMIVFVAFLFRRYFSKSKKSYHLLLWGIGMTFYLIGSLMESLHAALGWNPFVFRAWYLFGAVLVAAWLGQGTVQLLMKRRVAGIKLATILLVILTAGSLYATVRVFTAQLEPLNLADDVETVIADNGFDEAQVAGLAASAAQSTALDEGEVSERRLSPLDKALVAEAESLDASVVLTEDFSVTTQPNITANVEGQEVTLAPNGNKLDVSVDGQPAGTILLSIGREMHGHAIVSSGVRGLTPFFNIYGLLTLVGGAIYSAYIFWRKRIMPNRVIGNVLIASGALMPGIGGLLSRFGLGGYLYLGELVGAILMFAGFIAATNRPQEASVPAPVTTAAAK